MPLANKNLEVSQNDIDRCMDGTLDAYQRPYLGEKMWSEEIRALLQVGFNLDEVCAILNSKHMRWAMDDRAGIVAYLAGYPDFGPGSASVSELVADAAFCS